MYRSLIKWKSIRNTREYCEAVTKVKKDLASASSEATKVNSYESIPGPKGIFSIGTLYQYLPVIGKWNLNIVAY